MKLSCVLTAVNNNKRYLDFIPLFIKTWNKLYPNVDVKIVLISNEIPEEYLQYKNNIILFEPLENISTAFISQFIRILYPSILNYDGGILITDMDMIPMNNTYYTKNIEKFGNENFIVYRDVLIKKYSQYAICYNIAINKIWSEIFNIKSIEDIKQKIIEVYKKNKYIEGRGKAGWSLDQQELFKYVNIWHKKTNNRIILRDNQTKYNRLCRSFLKHTISKDKQLKLFKQKIRQHKFSDYHCLVPHKKFEIVNNLIYDML